MVQDKILAGHCANLLQLPL